MADDRIKNARSRDLGEGGYTFLHRIFREHFSGGQKPVIINTGTMYLSYSWKPGDKNFTDGITILRGESSCETFSQFTSCADNFQISKAFEEGKISIPM